MISDDLSVHEQKHDPHDSDQPPLPTFQRSRGGKFDATVRAGILTALAGLFPVAGLLAMQRHGDIFSLLCLLGGLGGMVYVPGLGVFCGWLAHVWFKDSSISPVRVAVALALIADLWLLGWVALIPVLGL